MDTTTESRLASDYLLGWREGYEMAAKGHLAANLVLVVLPHEDEALHDRVRQRIREVLRDEGIFEASIVDIIS